MDDILSRIAELGFSIWEWFGVSENRNRSTAIATVFGALAILIGVLWVFIKFCFKAATNKGKAKPNQTHPNAISLTPEQFAANNAALLIEAQANLQTAHDEEKVQLLQQIEELQKRAANPEAALQKARETITKLEDAMTREGNEHDIGEARMTQAVDALEAGDFTLADDIFAEIEAREQLAVERTARAAYARGKIAEQDIRWPDAAEHYACAAALHPTYDNLFSAHTFAWRNGEYEKAMPLGTALLERAETEFGDTHEKYTAALNAHALTLHATGKYDQAESLYRQATAIDKHTIGETHPNYATRLNNLAELYYTTGKYDLAEPLYKQAIKIAEISLGPDHPSTKTVKANYAKFLKTRP